MGLRSSARRSAEGLLLRGRKRSITNVGVADLVLVSVRLAGLDPGQAINAVGVELPRAGAFARPITDLVGLRTSPTGNLLLRKALVPEASLVGGIGGGVALFRQTFSLERLLTGAIFLAAIRLCARRAVAFAEEREQFGSPIGKNQYVQDRIVRMRVAAELLGAMLSRAASQYDRGTDLFGSLSVIKIHGAEAATDAAHGLMRILASRGVRRREPAERMVRDLLALAIFGGTVELHKVIVYDDTVRQHRRSTRPTDAASSPFLVEVRDARRLDPAFEAGLIDLVARALPDQPALRGPYYYDSAPDEVVVAMRVGRPVGVRMLIDRVVTVRSRAVRVAGTGIAVDPEHQRRGIGKALTERVLELARQRKVELVLSFLFSDASERLLRSFGFRPLQATVTHDARDGSGVVVERARCFALSLGALGLLDEIEESGTLSLGVGTW